MIERNDPTLDRYLNGDYAFKNPDWDSKDAKWKAAKLYKLLFDNRCQPSSIVEIGCGSGAILSAMRGYYPETSMAGYDIAPEVRRFWKTAAEMDIHFEIADYLSMDKPSPDLILVLDVLEHLGNPWEFLARLRLCSKLVAFHIPLDLSAISVVRESPLLNVREKVGHLHYFTRKLALSLLIESGFEIIDSRYTGAALNIPHPMLRTRMSRLLRRFVYAINRELGVLLLGGETLLVLARPKAY